MKITRKKLENIIKQELQTLLEQGTTKVGYSPPARNVDGSLSQYTGTSGKTFKNKDNLTVDKQTTGIEGDLNRDPEGEANNIANQNQLIGFVSEIGARLSAMEYPNIDDDPSAFKKDLSDISRFAKMLLKVL